MNYKDTPLPTALGIMEASWEEPQAVIKPHWPEPSDDWIAVQQAYIDNTEQS